LYVRDGDTGAEARAKFFCENCPESGDYAILHRGDKDGFRLEPYDSLFGDDRNDVTGQSHVRLHAPGHSNGCITACDASGWAQVNAVIKNTSTSQVEVIKFKSLTLPGGYVPMRYSNGTTEMVKYYGRLKVK
jgi:hypothetical protein